MDFCDKLVYIMGELQLTSAGLARKIPVDPALVSRWRTGRRIPKDGDTITRITTAVLESARTEQEKALLQTLISNYEEEGLSTAEKISRWFFDGSGIQTPPVMRPSQPAGVCLRRPVPAGQ